MARKETKGIWQTGQSHFCLDCFELRGAGPFVVECRLVLRGHKLFPCRSAKALDRPEPD